MKKTLFLLFFLANSSLFAQFNTRISLETSLGYSSPTYFSFAKTDTEGFPRFFPNFTVGANLSAGLYYRLNRKLSIGTQLAFYYFTEWENPVSVNDQDDLLQNARLSEKNVNSEFQTLEVSSRIRYSILEDRRISPFLVGGFGVYAYRGILPARAEVIARENESKEGTDIKSVLTVLRFDPTVVRTQLTWGLHGGLGVDFNLSRYFTLYWQACYTSVFTLGEPVLKLNTHFISQNIGMRVNIFRKKSLL